MFAFCSVTVAVSSLMFAFCSVTVAVSSLSAAWISELLTDLILIESSIYLML
ncbi:hypothetical protein PO909_029756, partial [Leuciscus waleckii]